MFRADAGAAPTTRRPTTPAERMGPTFTSMFSIYPATDRTSPVSAPLEVAFGRT